MLTFGIRAMFDHNTTAWLSAVLQQASSSSTTDREPILDSDLVVVVLTTMAIVPSNINVDAPPTCSTKCPSRVVNITTPTMVNAVAEEIVVAPDHVPTHRKTFIKYADVIVSDKPDVTLDMEFSDAAATFLHRGGISDDIPPPVEASEVAPSKIAVDMELLTPPPAKCSTKGPSLLLVNFKAPLCAEGTTLNFYPEKLPGGVAVLWEQTMKWTKRQPWPPHMQVGIMCCTADIRQIPWPPTVKLKSIHAGADMRPIPWPSYHYDGDMHSKVFYRLSSRQWDPGNLKYAPSSSYEISSSFQFVQSSVTLLMPFLHVLYYVYLNTQSDLVLSISTSTWLRRSAIVMTMELQLMSWLWLFSRGEKCTPISSRRQQASLGDGEVCQDVKIVCRKWVTKSGKRGVGSTLHSVIWGQVISGFILCIKWTSLVLKYSVDITIGEFDYKQYAGNIIKFSSNAMEVWDCLSDMLSRQSWLVPVLLNKTCDGVVLWPIPWPSFCWYKAKMESKLPMLMSNNSIYEVPLLTTTVKPSKLKIKLLVVDTSECICNGYGLDSFNTRHARSWMIEISSHSILQMVVSSFRGKSITKSILCNKDHQELYTGRDTSLKLLLHPLEGKLDVKKEGMLGIL